MSDNGDSSTEVDDEVRSIKLIVTIVVLIVAFLVSLIVAKLVDICYDKRAIRDDASDISENTRNLIRARLSVIQFKKRERRKTEKDGERKLKQSAIMDFFRKWAQKVRARRKTREIAIKSQTPSSDDSVVVTVDKEDGLNHSSASCNSSTAPRSPRLPLFSGGKMPTGAQKTANSTFKPRPISGKLSHAPPIFGASMSRNSVISTEHSSPVSGPSAKSRPVSSKPRDLPNVSRADVDSNSKVQVKSVHFENPSLKSADSKTKQDMVVHEEKGVMKDTEITKKGNGTPEIAKKPPEAPKQRTESSKQTNDDITIINVDT